MLSSKYATTVPSQNMNDDGFEDQSGTRPPTATNAGQAQEITFPDRSETHPEKHPDCKNVLEKTNEQYSSPLHSEVPAGNAEETQHHVGDSGSSSHSERRRKRLVIALTLLILSATGITLAFTLSLQTSCATCNVCGSDGASLDPDDGHTCEPPNPCETSTHNCSEHAVCIITSPGNYSCQCLDGFQGNGRTCELPDLCLAAMHDCSEHATCISMGLGNYNCQCHEGYQGDGWTCELLGICPLLIGQELVGDAEYTNYGSAIALSSDGFHIAVGAIGSGSYGRYAGQVRIFDHDANSDRWLQRGQDINGEADYDSLGSVIAMSSDGARIAIGAPETDSIGYADGHVRILEYSTMNEQWEPIGQVIRGEAAGDHCGSALAMSSNGSRLAIGSPSSSVNRLYSGQVRIFDYNNSSQLWQQIDNGVGRDMVAINFGRAVAMSSDGSRVAVSGFGDDGISWSVGRVRVFAVTTSEQLWEQVGQDLDAEAADDNAGFAIALNSDGSRLVVGAPWNSANGDYSGNVRTFDFNTLSQQWEQIGQTINGESINFLGGAVAISSDGSRVALGSRASSDARFRILDYNATTDCWEPVSLILENDRTGDYPGVFAIALSSNGFRTGMGAPWNDGYDSTGSLLRGVGRVHVYDLESCR